MTNSTSAKNLESAQHNLRIKVLLEKLKTKLRNFSVLDKQGFLLGQVRDVKLDSSRQLNLVISEADNPNNPRLFLLRSTHIQQVDSKNKTVFVDLSKKDTENLSEYKPRQTLNADLSKPSPSSVPVGIEAMKPTAPAVSNLAESNDGIDEQDEDDLEDIDLPVMDEVIRLLEERLVVDVKKHKLGEVIIRKEVETHIIQVPVRREKLIVEQIDPERKQLAEIDLGQAEIPQFETHELAHDDGQPTVKGVFNSLKTASLILDAIAKQRNHGCKQVRVEIVLENPDDKATYQEWFDRCSSKF